MRGPRYKRLSELEAQRRAFEAAHVRRSDLPGFLFAVLQVVQEEAGTPTFQRVACRIVQGKAARVSALARGEYEPFR